jgi:hypothetical protein
MMWRWSRRQEEFFPLNGMAKDCHGQVAGERERARERARERKRGKERASVSCRRREEVCRKNAENAKAPNTNSGMAG